MTLTADEELAVDIAADVYRSVRNAPALDSTDHWERFANRIRSAAYAQTGARFLEQIARRFGVTHTPGDGIRRLLALPRAEQRKVLRLVREESNAISVLVRDRRDTERKTRNAA